MNSDSVKAPFSAMQTGATAQSAASMAPKRRPSMWLPIAKIAQAAATEEIEEISRQACGALIPSSQVNDLARYG